MPMLPITKHFALQAARTPQALAVQCLDQRITFGALARQANQVAHSLLAQGLRANTPVPVVLPPGIEAVVALLGVLQAGGAFVPVDPDYPSDRLNLIVDACNAGHVITCVQTQSRVNAPSTTLEVMLQGNENPALVDRATLAGMAYIIYTSGSTGKPKGVMVAHSQVAHYMQGVGAALGLNQCQSFAALGTFAADAPYTAIFAALCYGKPLHVVHVKKIPSFGQLVQYFNAHRIDCYKTTPSLMGLFMKEGNYQALLPHKILVLGGEACPPALPAQLLPQLSAGCALHNHYGPTETTIGVTTYRFTGAAPLQEVPLGQPLPHVTAHVLNPAMQPAAPNEAGELYIEGPLVAMGYYQQPALTSQRFVTLPASMGGGRAYKTGDVVKQGPNGLLYYCGRTDEQVKVNGNRIELEEIEKTIGLTRLVRQCVVAVKTIQAVKKIVAYYQPNAQTELGQLKQAVARQLPGYMVPFAWVAMQAWPMTFNNKIDKKALPLPVAVPQSNGPAGHLQGEPLYQTWCRLLGVADCDPTLTFFELGGDSLQLIQLSYAVDQHHGVTIAPAVLFGGLTYQGLAAYVAQHATQQPAQASTGGGEVTEAQRNLYIRQKLNPGVPFPHSYLTFQVTGPLDVAALNQALQRVVARHEALRTTYHLAKSKVVATVHPNVPFEVTRHQASTAHLGQALASLSVAFNYAQPPLLRVVDLWLANDQRYLHIEMPHINSDGESLKVLVDDLQQAMQQPRQVLAPAYQYHHFVAQHNQYLGSEQYQADAAYWQGQLEKPLPALPARPAAPPQPGSRLQGHHVVQSLPAEAIAQILAQPALKGLTSYQLLVAVFALLQGATYGTSQVSVLTPVHNRLSQRAEKIVGLLTNVVPLRFTLAHHQPLQQWLLQCQQHLLQAMRHQCYPFEHLIKSWKQAGHPLAPLMQSFFGYHRLPDTLQLGQARLQLVHPQRQYEDLPLSMAVTQTPAGYALRLSASQQWHSPQALQQLANNYTQLLQQLANNTTNQPLGQALAALKQDFTPLKQ